jgi:hypothetical protein
MQGHEASKPKDVPPSHTQERGQQGGTQRTDWYRPETSRLGRQDASSSTQYEALQSAQGLFEPGASRPSQSVGARPERRNPPVTDFRTDAQKAADKEANLKWANQMFESPRR